MAIQVCQYYPQSEGTSCIHFILLRNKLLQILAASSNKYVLYIVSVVQGTRCNLAGCLWLMVSCEVAVELSVRAAVSFEGSSDGGSISKITCIVLDRPPPVGLLLGLPCAVQLASPRMSSLRGREHQCPA